MPAVKESQVSGSSSPSVDGTHSPQFNSSYLRELTHGNFLIKFEEITELENIGQGNAVANVFIAQQMNVLFEVPVHMYHVCLQLIIPKQLP